jgi:hypothetical protein
MAKKRTTSKLGKPGLTSLGMLHSKEDFDAIYGGAFVICGQRTFAITQWNPTKNLEHAEKLTKWIKQVSPTWVSTHFVLPRQSNACCLYTAVFDILRDTLVLANTSLTTRHTSAAKVDVCPLFDEVVLASAEGVEAIKSEEPPTMSRSLSQNTKATIDVSDSVGIAKLFCEIDNRLNGHSVERFLELVISELFFADPENGPREMTRIVVQVRRSLQVDDDAGFYQLCGELADRVQAAETIFGVYTDASAFEFVCISLDTTALGKRRIIRSQREQFVHIPEPGKPVLHKEGLEVLAYILNMLGVPPSIDMDQLLTDMTAAQTALLGDFLRDI